MAALRCCQAREPVSRHRVLPVPVGLSRRAFFCSTAGINERDTQTGSGWGMDGSITRSSGQDGPR